MPCVSNWAVVSTALAFPNVTVPGPLCFVQVVVTDAGGSGRPSSVTTTWTKQSGPGTVTFGDASAVDTTAQFETHGTYVLRLTADDDDTTAYDEVTVGVSPRIALPAKIEAEDYRYGGEGLGYHGISTKTCEDEGGGYYIHMLSQDDWAAYDVNVPASGDYTFTFRYRACSTEYIHVMMDDTNVTG